MTCTNTFCLTANATALYNMHNMKNAELVGFNASNREDKIMDKVQVFLSYKSTDAEGRITPDALLAEELYEVLMKRGINTFYSSQSIKRLGESHYKIAIDKALDEALILVAVGTSTENLNSNWVNYEWDSFYGDILSGRKEGQVISFINCMKASELPRTLRRCQAFSRAECRAEDVSDFICAFLNNQNASKPELNPNDCRILSLTELMKKGITALDAERAFSDNDKGLYVDMPEEVAGTPEKWAAIIEKNPDFVAVVSDSKYNIYGNYSMVGLTPVEEKKMVKGALVDTDISPFSVDDLNAAGKHTGYLLNMSVNPSSESPELYNALWNHLVETLKRYATEKKVFFSKIYYKAFLPEHEARVVARGFRLCCKDSLFGNVYVHDMDPLSTLYAFDKELAEIYLSASTMKQININPEIQDVAILSAYMDFWRQIEELFYRPEYVRLKKYFMGNTGLPNNTVEHKMALAVSEWIRDNLQYSEALLPYIPDNQRYAHNRFKKLIYDSEIIKESMRIYQFTTEEADARPVNIGGYSVNSLVTFANIWLDIDKIFMLPELLDFKRYFYEDKSSLPAKEDLELGEMIAVRILSILKISERQLKHLPIEYAESYYNYKDMILSSELTRSVLTKHPFLRGELG